MQIQSLLVGGLLGGVGFFAVAAAVMDWTWFMNHRKARFFIQLFGRNGARVFYGLLGFGLMVFGMVMALGLFGLQNPP